MASRKEVRQTLPSSIIPTLEGFPELSTLFSYVNSSTTLYTLLNTTKNFTFLAPTNDAISQWIQTNGNSTPSADVIEATLSYHILNGSWPTVDFKDEPQFVATSLNNASYANVTIPPGGQRVELVNGPGGDPQILSNNKTATTIYLKDTVCFNGFVQIVNSVLTIPTTIVNLVAQANMAYLIAILNKANYASVNTTGIIDFANYATFTPNTTFFLPNTQAALDWFNNVSTTISADNLTSLFNYHLIPNTVLYSPDFVNGTILTSHQGDNATLTIVGNDTYVNSAKILATDFLTTNGVIHTVDSFLMPFNQTIIPQPINTTTNSSSSSTFSPSPTPSSSHSGLSTGAIAAIGVVIPVVVLAAVAFGLFWFMRKRKATQAQHELDAATAAATAREMEANPAAKEMPSNYPAAKELWAQQHFDARYPPHELAGGINSLPPVELQ